MTDDIKNYEFDFETEVEALKEILGSLGNGILFVNVDIDPLRNDEPVKILQAIGNTPIKQKVLNHIVRDYEDELGKKQPDLGSYQNYITRSGIRSKFVSIVENESYTDVLGEKNKPLMRLFTLYHETAHALIPGPAVDNDHPRSELIGDAYAAIRLLQRFGQEAMPFLSQVSWERAYYSLYGTTMHLTTPVLDKIILDCQRENCFSGLSAEETMKRAEAYAREMTPEPSVLSATRAIFDRGEGDTVTQYLASTCLSSPVNPFADYIFAKAAQIFFLPKGELVYCGKVWQSKEQEQLDKVRSTVEARTAGMTLHDIFKDKSKKPIAKALKITRLRGQKQFVYKAP